MKPYEMKIAKLCFSFPNAQSALYFPLENTVPEIVLRIHYNKPVKVLLAFVHYGKILHIGAVSRQT